MGSEKWALRFGAQTLIERLTLLLAPQVGEIVIAAAPGQEIPLIPGSVSVVRDQAADQGPLEGIMVGLQRFSRAIELVYLTSVDAPFLEPSWVAGLRLHLGDAEAVIPCVDGIDQPLRAIYRRASLQQAVSECLTASAGDRSVRTAIARLRTARLGHGELAELDPDFRSLINMNTAEEYERARRTTD